MQFLIQKVLTETIGNLKEKCRLLSCPSSTCFFNKCVSYFLMAKT